MLSGMEKNKQGKGDGKYQEIEGKSYFIYDGQRRLFW